MEDCRSAATADADIEIYLIYHELQSWTEEKLKTYYEMTASPENGEDTLSTGPGGSMI